MAPTTGREIRLARRLSPNRADYFYLCFPHNPERPGSRVVAAVLSIRSAMAAVGCESNDRRYREMAPHSANPGRPLSPRPVVPVPLLFVSRISEALVGRAYMLGVVPSLRCWAFRLRAPSSHLSCHNFVLFPLFFLRLSASLTLHSCARHFYFLPPVATKCGAGFQAILLAVYFFFNLAAWVISSHSGGRTT